MTVRPFSACRPWRASKLDAAVALTHVGPRGERLGREVLVGQRVEQLCRGGDLVRRHRVRHQALDLIRDADLGGRPREEACLDGVRPVGVDRRDPCVAEHLEGALLPLAQYTRHDRHGASSPRLTSDATTPRTGNPNGGGRLLVAGGTGLAALFGGDPLEAMLELALGRGPRALRTPLVSLVSARSMRSGVHRHALAFGLCARVA